MITKGYRVKNKKKTTHFILHFSIVSILPIYMCYIASAQRPSLTLK